jgi:hypothetical protein
LSILSRPMTAPTLAHATSLDTRQQSYISDGSGRLRRTDAAKVSLSRFLTSAAARAYDDESADAGALYKMATLLEECRRGAPVRDALCGAYTIRPNSCHVRLCPDCERARSARLVHRYDEIASQMASPRFWTLTLPNVRPGELRPAIGVLLDAMAHLRRRSIVAGGPCKGGHRAVAYDDVDQAAHHVSGADVATCSHPPHRRELAVVGSCRCARCIEVDVIHAGERVTVNGCPRCTHDAVAGGVYSVEVTWSPRRTSMHRLGYKETDDWHPHAHVLMDAPWIVQSEMRDAWRAVTCDAIRRAELQRSLPTTGRIGPLPRCDHPADARGVGISGCRGASIVWVNAVAGAPGSPERLAAVRETLKYVSKGILDPADPRRLLPGASELELAELLLAIRGRRLVAGWGSFRLVHDDDEDELDPAKFLVGPDVPAGLVGMPKICPCCGREAVWELPLAPVLRIDCRRLPSGALVWRPPNEVGADGLRRRPSSLTNRGSEPVDPLAWARALVAYDFRNAFQ